jgi:hypothetical protein
MRSGRESNDMKAEYGALMIMVVLFQMLVLFKC